MGFSNSRAATDSAPWDQYLAAPVEGSRRLAYLFSDADPAQTSFTSLLRGLKSQVDPIRLILDGLPPERLSAENPNTLDGTAIQNSLNRFRRAFYSLMSLNRADWHECLWYESESMTGISSLIPKRGTPANGILEPEGQVEICFFELRDSLADLISILAQHPSFDYLLQASSKALSLADEALHQYRVELSAQKPPNVAFDGNSLFRHSLPGATAPRAATSATVSDGIVIAEGRKCSWAQLYQCIVALRSATILNPGRSAGRAPGLLVQRLEEEFYQYLTTPGCMLGMLCRDGAVLFFAAIQTESSCFPALVQSAATSNPQRLRGKGLGWFGPVALHRENLKLTGISRDEVHAGEDRLVQELFGTVKGLGVERLIGKVRVKPQRNVPALRLFKRWGGEILGNISERQNHRGTDIRCATLCFDLGESLAVRPLGS